MDAVTKRQFKNEIYDQFARIGKAFANGHRLELLDLIAQGEHTVEQLAAETDMSVANASQHLQVLRAAQLVAVRRDGLYAHYRLADERVFAMWQAMRQLAESQLVEVEEIVNTYLHERQNGRPLSADDLLGRLQDGGVTLLDVRPASEYQAAHIPGALSIPIEELATRLHELPKSREVVAYCRGPYCVYADEAVALLQANGFRAWRFEQGIPDWRVAGLPIKTESADPV